MRGLGTVVNVGTVLAGTGLGLMIGSRIPERVRETVMHGVGLATLVLGMTDSLRTRNVVFPLVAIVIGGAIGELLRLEDRLDRLGERVRAQVERGPRPGEEQGGDAEGDRPSTFVEGFVSASLLFCVGPLTILGSISDGLGRGAQELIIKAALDGLVSIVFASTLGVGVAFSVVTIVVVQGGLTAGAGLADRVLTTRMITEMTATGGLMILGIGLRLLDIKRLRVGSFLPALLIAPIGVALFAR